LEGAIDNEFDIFTFEELSGEELIKSFKDKYTK
jgi:hypothetical protein